VLFGVVLVVGHVRCSAQLYGILQRVRFKTTLAECRQVGAGRRARLESRLVPSHTPLSRGAVTHASIAPVQLSDGHRDDLMSCGVSAPLPADSSDQPPSRDPAHARRAFPPPCNNHTQNTRQVVNYLDLDGNEELDIEELQSAMRWAQRLALPQDKMSKAAAIVQSKGPDHPHVAHMLVLSDRGLSKLASSSKLQLQRVESLQKKTHT
jgi:hypothetical protein